MKKIILYASVIGVTIGIASHLLNKKSKSNVSKNQSVGNEFDLVKPNISDQEFVSAPNVEEEITDAKNSSVHSIQDRHTEASNIMYSAFENVYKDIEPVEYDEKKSDSGVVESVINNSELDLVSDELGDLLK